MPSTLAQWTPRVAPRTVDGTSLLIGGRETTLTDLRAQSLRCELLLDARSKFSCQLIAPPVEPTVDMDVLFTLAGMPWFGGIVVEVARAGDLYTVTAADNLAILDGLLVNNVSPAGTLSSVLQWMIDTSLGVYGFTIDSEQEVGPDLPAIAFPFQSYAAALKQLGTLTGWSLAVSPARIMKLYPGLDGSAPPLWPIDETTDTIQSLTARSSREGHATHVYVRFGSGAPAVIHWGTAGNGIAVSWEPPYYIATPPSTVEVNAVTYPVGPYPAEPGWTGWTWEARDPEGTLRAPAGAPPLTASDTLVITFTASWPSVAVAYDVTYPLHVGVVIDYPDVFDSTYAQGLADGELLRRQGFPQKFTLRTARLGLQLGMRVPIDVPSMGLDTVALVTSVRLVHANNVGPAGTVWWALDVELVEANASRGNWTTFWAQLQAGGGTGGGTGSSVTGTIPPAPPTGGGTGGAVDYATWPLGGDHDAGYPSATGTDWQGIANACFAVTPAAFTGRTWTVYATVKRLLGTGTFQLALFNAAGVSIATSAVVTFAGGAFASVVFTAPIVPGETYHLRGLTSNATTVVGTTGYLEAVRT